MIAIVKKSENTCFIGSMTVTQLLMKKFVWMRMF